MRWVAQEPPLAIEGVVAIGAPARALARRARLAPDGLRGLRAQDLLLLLGPAPQLPWVEGAVWIGRSGALLLPTLQRPAPPLDLLTRAIQREHPTLQGPWLLLPEHDALIGAGIAGPLDPTRLAEVVGGS